MKDGLVGRKGFQLSLMITTDIIQYSGLGMGPVKENNKVEQQLPCSAGAGSYRNIRLNRAIRSGAVPVFSTVTNYATWLLKNIVQWPEEYSPLVTALFSFAAAFQKNNCVVSARYECVLQTARSLLFWEMTEKESAVSPAWPAYLKGVQKYMKSTELGRVLVLAVAVTAVSAAGAKGDTPLRSLFNVTGLSCEACLLRVSSKLHGLAGVIGLEADMAAQQVMVAHAPELSAEQIGAALQKSGYQACLVTGKLGTKDVGGQETVGGRDCSVSGLGMHRSRRCGAVASAWKEFYRRYFGKDKVLQTNP